MLFLSFYANTILEVMEEKGRISEEGEEQLCPTTVRAKPQCMGVRHP
jgi:hypothetical protein